MPTPQRFVIPFNVGTSATLIAERLLPDNHCELLICEEGIDKTMKAPRGILDQFLQAGIQIGDQFDIVKYATENVDGLCSHIVITKKEPCPVSQV